MSDKICRSCEKLLVDGDLLKATVVARYKALKSKLIYGLSQPTSCLYVQHYSCKSPQGEGLDDDINEENFGD